MKHQIIHAVNVRRFRIGLILMESNVKRLLLTKNKNYDIIYIENEKGHFSRRWS